MSGQPEPERYVTVPLTTLEAIRALWAESDTDRLSVPTVRLVLQVAHVDRISGNLVVSVKALRDLDET
jgi:hypothetical protein